jgi:hypothetical protein
MHGKEEQQRIVLIWKWNNAFAHSLIATQKGVTRLSSGGLNKRVTFLD